jgi:hypothetical protein
MSRSSWIGATIVYLGAACLLTWPLATALTTHLGALEGEGDPYLNVWILGWGLHAWKHDPSSIFNGRVFDANIFHPSPGSMTFSDHLLLQSLVLSPIYALTNDVVLCYNLLLLISLAASGLAMHALIRGVTGSTAAGFVAGLAWACWPYRTAHLLHLQLQSMYFLPLAILAVHRIAAARHWRDAIALGVWAALQAISSVYYGVMTAIAVVTAAVTLAWSTGQWRNRRFWTRMAIAGLVGVVLIAPVAWPYWRTQQREGFGRNLYEAAAHSATLQSYTQAPPDNLIYGRTGLLPLRPPAPGERDRRHVEHQMFPGITLLCLAAFGLWRGWRSDSRPVALSGLALVAVGGVLSLGPEGIRVVYASVSDWVFGFQAIRAPARFAVVAVAGLCILAGTGVARARLAGPALAVVVLALLVEYANAPLHFVPAPVLSTAVGQWLKSQSTPGAVLYLPLPLDKENSTYMVQSLEHRRPIVNGYSGQRPAIYTSLVEAFKAPASLDARVILNELKVRFVVSRFPLAGVDQPESPYVERTRLDGDVIYEVVWTEASLSALVPTDGPEPPAPGPPPFAAGERAIYEVLWLGGPVDLSAGTITLQAASPTSEDIAIAADAKWSLAATAETAPWVSRFFEAHDRFQTTTDELLRPLAHVREIREGPRRLDRVFLYDRTNRRVRIGESLASAQDTSAATLPLAAGARDALSALWYVRSLPLAPGFHAELPLNEGGQRLAIEFTVEGQESVITPAGTFAALRLAPHFLAGARRDVQSTIWITDDARRLPVLVEISAGFGRLRLKLVDYRP